MSESTGKMKNERADRDDLMTKQSATADKPEWEAPKMEDVSEQVMAQPYIRFT